MKVKYDVCDFFGGLTLRYENLKEAFELAKKVAAGDEFGESILKKITWDDLGQIVEYKTYKVKANGTFEYL